MRVLLEVKSPIFIRFSKLSVISWMLRITASRIRYTNLFILPAGKPPASSQIWKVKHLAWSPWMQSRTQAWTRLWTVRSIWLRIVPANTLAFWQIIDTNVNFKHIIFTKTCTWPVTVGKELGLYQDTLYRLGLPAPQAGSHLGEGPPPCLPHHTCTCSCQELRQVSGLL